MLDLRSISVGHGGPDDDVGLRHILVYQRLERRQQRHQQSYAFSLAQSLEGVAQLGREQDRFRRSTMTGDRRPRAIAGQIQLRPLSTELSLPVPQVFCQNLI